MKTRHIIPTLFFLCLLIRANAQEIRPNFPNGFHLGLVQTISVAPAMSVIPDGTSLSALKSEPTFGGKIGIEFSYHFARYFGVSIGLDYGSCLQYNLKEYDADGNPHENNRWPLKSTRLVDFFIPIKFEFHYPVSKSVLFYGSLGVNLKNAYVFYPQFGNIIYGGLNNGTSLYINMREYERFNVDMLISMGIYYRLPYNDLLRFGVSTNIAFRDKLQGYYQFQNEGNAGGTLSYRHNLIGLEFGYIHCFRTKEQRTAFTNTR